jgi:hypothetical protein
VRILGRDSNRVSPRYKPKSITITSNTNIAAFRNVVKKSYYLLKAYISLYETLRRTSYILYINNTNIAAPQITDIVTLILLEFLNRS